MSPPIAVWTLLCHGVSTTQPNSLRVGKSPILWRTPLDCGVQTAPLAQSTTPPEVVV